MSSAIYFRVLGYITTIALHGINSIVMLVAIQDEILLKDPDIKNLAGMQSNFLTIWNIAFQISYAALGLACDVLTLMNKDDMLPKSVHYFRHGFFATIVYPITVLIFTVFWPIYLYDRNLIFPEFIDKVFSQKSNYVMHISIAAIVMWEVIFQPRTVPKSHKLNVQIVILYFITYNAVIFYNYFKTGLWPYPMLGFVYGTIYFPILFVGIFLATILSYYTQWPVTKLFWDTKKINVKKVK